jgi:hypothetical protein
LMIEQLELWGSVLAPQSRVTFQHMYIAKYV